MSSVHGYPLTTRAYPHPQCTAWQTRANTLGGSFQAGASPAPSHVGFYVAIVGSGGACLHLRCTVSHTYHWLQRPPRSPPHPWKLVGHQRPGWLYATFLVYRLFKLRLRLCTLQRDAHREPKCAACGLRPPMGNFAVRAHKACRNSTGNSNAYKVPSRTKQVARACATCAVHRGSSNRRHPAPEATFMKVASPSACLSRAIRACLQKEICQTAPRQNVHKSI